MTKQDKKEILEILRSGNFTFAFNDSYYGDLISKKVKTYEQYSDLMDGESIDCFELEMGNYGDELVELLIEALGGSCVST